MFEPLLDMARLAYAGTPEEDAGVVEAFELYLKEYTSQLMNETETPPVTEELIALDVHETRSTKQKHDGLCCEMRDVNNRFWCCAPRNP